MVARMEWESDEQYKERSRFFEWYKKRCHRQKGGPEDEHQIVSMAQCYANVRFFQSIYDDEIMEVIQEYKRQCSDKSATSPTSSQRGSLSKVGPSQQAYSKQVYTSGPQPRSYSAEHPNSTRYHPPQQQPLRSVDVRQMEHTYVYVPPQARGVPPEYYPSTQRRYPSNDRSDATYYVQQRRSETYSNSGQHSRHHSEHNYRQDVGPPPTPPAPQPPNTYYYQPPTYFDQHSRGRYQTSTRTQPAPVNRRW